MGLKSNVVVALTVATLGVGALRLTDPIKDDPAQRQSEQVEQLSDQKEKTDEQLRREGNDLGDATYRDHLQPGEIRPPERLPGVRVRIRP